MAEFPALPLFTDSYLADTEHLSDAEHGLYLRILILMWRSPECRIPDDDIWIARKLRKAEDAMRTHVRPLLSEFCIADGKGWLTQKRLRREFEWVKNNRKRMADLANRRWDKGKDQSVGNAGDAKHPTLPNPIKKDAREARGQNGFSGKKEPEAVAYPDEQKRAEIMKRIGAPTIYSEAELKKQAETIKARLPCPGASPGRVAVMLAHGWVSEEDCRAAGVTW